MKINMKNLNKKTDSLTEFELEMLEWLIRDLLNQDILEAIKGQVDRSSPWIKEEYGESFANWLIRQRDEQIQLIEKTTGMDWIEVQNLVVEYEPEDEEDVGLQVLNAVYEEVKKMTLEDFENYHDSIFGEGEEQ